MYQEYCDYIFSNVVNLELHPMIPFYYIHYVVDLQFQNTFTMPLWKLQEKRKKKIVDVDIEEMQVHNNSLCLFFLSYVKLKKSEDARTETEDKAFGLHLIQLDPIFYAVFKIWN